MIGLELVSIKLSDPFGIGGDDFQISDIRDAAILGIENDLKEMTMMRTTISERRLKFLQQRKTKNQKHLIQQSQSHEAMSIVHVNPDSNTSSSVYHVMGAGDIIL